MLHFFLSRFPVKMNPSCPSLLVFYFFLVKKCNYDIKFILQKSTKWDRSTSLSSVFLECNCYLCKDVWEGRENVHPEFKHQWSLCL